MENKKLSRKLTSQKNNRNINIYIETKKKKKTKQNNCREFLPINYSYKY